MVTLSSAACYPQVLLITIYLAVVRINDHFFKVYIELFSDYAELFFPFLVSSRLFNFVQNWFA